MKEENVYCEKCERWFDWLDIDDEDVVYAVEGRGECHGFPAKEIVLEGFICPICREKQYF